MSEFSRTRERIAVSAAAVFMLLSLAAAAPAPAELLGEEVEYKAGDTVLRGYLVYDAASEAERPGVLVVHEWWGLNDHARSKADDLAREGYVALAVDMYGEGKTTDHPGQAGEWASFVRQNREIGASRFEAARRLLQEHPLSDGDRTAAIGFCFGGHLVLAQAQNGADLAAVVSFHGSLPTAAPEADTIRARILVCHGADDPLISRDQIDRFQDNMREADADWQFISYGGARHSFTNPAADDRGAAALGYDPAADRRSWGAMLALFEEVFAR